MIFSFAIGALCNFWTSGVRPSFGLAVVCSDRNLAGKRGQILYTDSYRVGQKPDCF